MPLPLLLSCIALVLLMIFFVTSADSAVLVLSVIAQILMMRRKLESWWVWLLVNTVAVPLYYSRGLHLTSILYVGFWINALVALRHWRNLMRVEAR
ncbi:hypothetical protein G6F40_016603 [Rhizopus arrhizus]|nr:hypothetical protein G6F40_016603 [Rhizopus arrhizus]